MRGRKQKCSLAHRSNSRNHKWLMHMADLPRGENRESNFQTNSQHSSPHPSPPPGEYFHDFHCTCLTSIHGHPSLPSRACTPSPPPPLTSLHCQAVNLPQAIFLGCPGFTLRSHFLSLVTYLHLFVFPKQRQFPPQKRNSATEIINYVY